MKYPGIPLFVLAAALSASPMAFAHNHDGDDDDNEEPFDEARLFFELNDTDGDLGIHGKIDGDEWKKLEIEDPNDRKMLNIKVRGRLKRQGLTELFFESAEPTFDELDPDEFFARFPEGEYDIEGKTLDGEERESEVYLSHVIPAAPDGVTINGEDAAEDCDADELPGVNPTGGVVIDWDPVTMSHAARHGEDGLGEDGVIEVRYYEVVIEIDESDFKTVAFVPPEVTSWTFSEDFFGLSDEGEYKYEILVRTNVYDDEGEPILLEIDDEDDQPLPGNKSAVEGCFEVE
ncbi:MAG: hypothetical protein GY875_01830 [Gammaproteobacteria bacterium]|nr:hypothetical protein [Gammaproteobacteria bacterium]